MHTESACRVCSVITSEEQMEKIFCTKKERSIETDELPLSVIMMNLCRVQVLPDDELPQNVCNKCKMALVNAKHIIQLCEESDRKFRKLLSKVDYKSVERLDRKADLEPGEIIFAELTEIESNVSNKPNSSNDETVCVTSNDEVIKTEDVFSLSYDENYESPSCHALNSSSEAEDVESSEQIVESPDGLNVCKICKVTLCSKSSLRQHQATHSSERPFECDKCDLKFKLKSHLTDHRRNIHEGIKKHRCEICNRLFYGSAQLKLHMMKHTKDYPHLCTHCGKRFAQQCYLKVHQKIHFGVKDLSCTHCDYVSGNRSALQMHIKGVHKVDKKHQCADCGLRFLYPSGLAGHMTTHTGDKKFQCPVCQVKFRTNSSLKEHSRIHTDEKPYSCKYCDKSFRIMTHRTVHERIHTGEKPYTCVICDKRFQTKSNLNAHTKTHDRA